MKTILLLIAVVGLGWLAAVLAIAGLIFFASLMAWVVITCRSMRDKEQERAERARVKRLVEQEQT
jgi:hypothetical protein